MKFCLALNSYKDNAGIRTVGCIGWKLFWIRYEGIIGLRANIQVPVLTGMKENKRSIQNERRHEKEDKIFEIRIEIRKVNILTGESNGLCREEILHFCSRNVISET